MRRTKILATLGPASESESVLKEMIREGLNGVRCNFSHGTAEDHRKRVELIRRVAKEAGTTVGILADLQGPKIRVAKFKQGSVMLEHGQKFVIDYSLPKDAGDEHHVGADYEYLHQDVEPGNLLLLDDGKLVFTVEKVQGTAVHCVVTVGGKLSNNKGINKRGGGLTAPALTEKDKIDIKTAAELGVDFVAVSFPRGPEDMLEARKLLTEAGSSAWLIAKVERHEAVEHMDALIASCDGVMVARGDLAVEIGEEYVPGVQKRLIQRSRDLDKIVITATQMMESMISSPVPTRAEVSDVANAVLDGTDCVMLSAETAVGDYPVKVINAMDRVCRAAEKHGMDMLDSLREQSHFGRVDEAIAMATMYIANHLDVKAILALTESGSSALWMSRVNASLIIYALTRNAETMGRMTLVRGVIPVHFDSTRMPKDYVNREATELLVRQDVLAYGDWVILTCGDHMGAHGGTNQLKIVKLGDVS
jgi:pyruvate kinase